MNYVKVSYNKESFEDEFIIRMTRHYENMLDDVLSNASIRIPQILPCMPIGRKQ